jgi:hypothetical protein
MFATGPVFPSNVDAQGRKRQVMTFSGKCCPNAPRGRQASPRHIRFMWIGETTEKGMESMFLQPHAPIKQVYTPSACHSRDLAWLVCASANALSL